MQVKGPDCAREYTLSRQTLNFSGNTTGCIYELNTYCSFQYEVVVDSKESGQLYNPHIIHRSDINKILYQVC